MTKQEFKEIFNVDDEFFENLKQLKSDLKGFHGEDAYDWDRTMPLPEGDADD